MKINTSHGWNGMKFDTLIECKMLYQMTPTASQSGVTFKVKLKITLFQLRGLTLKATSDMNALGVIV
jgi:hypothetical protein